MKTQLASIVSVVIGGLLLCSLLVRTQFSDGKLVDWSDQQAKEYGQAGDDVHRLKYSLPSQEGDDVNVTARLAEAEARFAQAQRDLRDARDRADQTFLLLKWGGIGMIALGACGFFASRAGE